MKYRITEHATSNNVKCFTVEYLRKGIFWGEIWEIVTEYKHPKIHIPLKFATLADAQAHVHSQKRVKQIVEEGEVD